MSKTKTPADKKVGAPEGDGAYRVLARKYRPTSFKDLIGQDAMVRTLENAFRTGRIAQAYMLTGVRGVGKTTTARIIARALNYSAPGVEGPTIDMPSEGEHCVAIMESRHPDVLEIDAASNTGVENVREIIEAVRYQPMQARMKVYIIDEVHMLSKAAFNALLKTLEEPPEHVKFVFATTEVRKVPVTVLSRCQRFDLRRVEVEELRKHFKGVSQAEGALIDDQALALIARAAEGSVRDGLSILDQAIAHARGKITGADVRGMLGLAERTRVLDLLETALQGNAGPALEALSALYRDGAEPAQIVSDLAEAVHVVTRIKAVGAEAADPTLSEAELAKANALAKGLSMPALARAWQMLLKGLTETQGAPRPLAAADMVLVRLAYAANLPTPGELMNRLNGPNGSPARGQGTPASSERAERPRASLPQPPARASASAPQQEPAAVEPQVDVPRPQSFEEVVQLAEAKRELKLSRALAENVRLVRFGSGRIEINLSGAPGALATELSGKLKQWTGEQWLVLVSDEQGGETLAEVRRARAEQEKARKAREIEAVKSHPSVQAVLKQFPDAVIEDVRPTPSLRPAPLAGEAGVEDEQGERKTRKS